MENRPRVISSDILRTEKVPSGCMLEPYNYNIYPLLVIETHYIYTLLTAIIYLNSPLLPKSPFLIHHGSNTMTSSIKQTRMKAVNVDLK